MHKHHGQLVDKRLVRRQSTLNSEVLFCFNNASAKELCPNSVDGNACRQWVIWADQPFCNAKAIEWCTCWKLSKSGWNSGLNGIPLHLEITECKHRAGALFVCCELNHDRNANRSDGSTLCPKLGNCDAIRVAAWNGFPCSNNGIRNGRLCNRFAVSIEEGYTNTLHFSDVGIGSRVDAHTVDLNGRSKINFPPRVVLACGMRGGFVVKVTIWIAINGKLCRSAVVG